MTWAKGKQLSTMTNSEQTLTFKYDANGIRTKKTVNNVEYEYTYVGDKLIRVESNKPYDYPLTIYYTADGKPHSFIYGGGPFYYMLNLQGDVIGIATGNGNVIVEYAYDSWGKPISVTVNNSIYEDVALANPLRYRGYVYDSETGLYYLQSRYYDPELCRFISADAYLVAGNYLQGTNMFAYCLNNPVRYSDPSGFSPIDVGAILDIFLSFIKSLFTIKYDVPLYSQGEYSLCWAFCQVMIEEYQSAGTPISQEKAEKRAIEIAKQLHGETGWNKGGFPLNAGKAINRFDENGREQISLFKLYYLLLTQGPVYAHYWNGDGNTSSHLVVITGVSLLEGKVYSNNPWGCAGEQTYSEFLNGFLNKPNDYDAPLFSITPTI